jgi:hypothetical protein
MTHQTKQSRTKKTGPQPERVKLEGNWKAAVKRALALPVPEGGWPKPPKRYKKRAK